VASDAEWVIRTVTRTEEAMTTCRVIGQSAIGPSKPSATMAVGDTGDVDDG
jgi:hypothetical protein